MNQILNKKIQKIPDYEVDLNDNIRNSRKRSQLLQNLSRQSNSRRLEIQPKFKNDLNNYHPSSYNNSPLSSQNSQVNHVPSSQYTYTPISTSNSNINIYDKLYDKNNLKKILAQEYKLTLKARNDRKQMQKQRQRQIQKQIIRKYQQANNKRLEEHYDRTKQNKNLFQKQYINSLQLKQNKKKQQIQEKQAFRQSIQKKLSHIKAQHHPSNLKSNFYKQFFKIHLKESAINDQLYMQNVSPNLKKRQYQIQKISYGNLNNLHQKYRIIQENTKRQQLRKKQELKEILNIQIRQKEQLRRNYSENRFNAYETRQRSNTLPYYDTIKNPVNLGVNPQNKYVIDHIRKSMEILNPHKNDNLINSHNMSNQEQNNKPMSLLARNGSQVLL